jgi:PAS domain-containing protein
MDVRFMRHIAKALAGLTTQSLRVRIALSLGITLIYVLAFVPLYNLVSRSAVALSILPIIVIANAFGPWGGFIAGLVFIPLNETLFVLAGEPVPYSFLGSNFWASHAVFIFIGVVVGYLKNVRTRLERELYERERAEKALRNSQEQLALITDSIPAPIGYVDSEQR